MHVSAARRLICQKLSLITRGQLVSRHELYHGYKGHRTPMPDEIRETLPRLYDLVRVETGQANICGLLKRALDDFF